MESFIKIIRLALAAATLAGCVLFEDPPPVITIDPLVLEEISPLPRAVVIKPVLEYEPVYAVMRIIEVSEVNGVQKFFLVRTGADKTQLRAGLEAEIGGDSGFAKIIGACKIVEIYGDFFRCEVLRLDYKIGHDAHIRIQTGEKLKE
jgi:hypothetical protein